MLAKELKPALVEVFTSYPELIAVYLFGSYLESKENARDIKLAVLLEQPVESQDEIYMRIYPILAYILAPLELELLFLHSLSLPLQFEIISTGEVIYSSDDNRRTNFEYVVSGEYMDYKYHLDIARQELFEAVKDKSTLSNQDLIAEKVNIIRSAVQRLKLLAQMPGEEFCGNEDFVDIAENRLRLAMEALFDLGHHLVVKAGTGVPSDYRSLIKLLTDSGIIPDGFARQIVGMSTYRKRLIHDNNKVVPEELYQLLKFRLSDFESFCQYGIDYLRS